VAPPEGAERHGEKRGVELRQLPAGRAQLRRALRRLRREQFEAEKPFVALHAGQPGRRAAGVRDAWPEIAALI
jgi:hypothetical protein